MVSDFTGSGRSYDSTMKMEPRTDVSQIEQSYVAVPSLM